MVCQAVVPKTLSPPSLWRLANPRRSTPNPRPSRPPDHLPPWDRARSHRRATLHFYRSLVWALTAVSLTLPSCVLLACALTPSNTQAAAILRERIPRMAKLETLQTGRCLREYNAQLTRIPDW